MGDLPQQLAPMPAAADCGRERGPRLRVAFRTLGCRLNQYDTEGIRAAMARSRPIEVVGWDEPADLYLLNSCTVTGRADQECRRLARQAKRRHPGGKVVVAGCYAQTQPEQLAAVAEIDAVIGNADKDDVAAWLPRVLAADPPAVADFAEDAVFDSPLIDAVPGRSRAFVKIQDGCNLRCTYCLIWKARGPGRSRPPGDVLAQLGLLQEAGYREVILAGIHLGGYGRDLAPRGSLCGLLALILERLPGLRIRLSSIHPNEVTPELLELFARHERLRPHLHISLQSGSSTVLARMKRPYRGQRARLALRRGRRPEARLRHRRRPDRRLPWRDRGRVRRDPAPGPGPALQLPARVPLLAAPGHRGRGHARPGAAGDRQRPRRAAAGAGRGPPGGIRRGPAWAPPARP